MMTQEEFALIIRNLPQASSLDLYRLGHAIRALYSEPQRILAVRARLHAGMVVRFFDDIDGGFRNGRIVALRDRDMTVDETERNLRHTHVPYVAIDLDGQATAGPEIVDVPRTRPDQKRPTRADFKVGNTVNFDDRHGMPLIGKIVRLNQKTATIETYNGQWRVSFGILRHVVDI